jgi:hypothetical protein
MQVVNNGNNNARLLMKKNLNQTENNWLKVKAAALT